MKLFKLLINSINYVLFSGNADDGDDLDGTEVRPIDASFDVASELSDIAVGAEEIVGDTTIELEAATGVGHMDGKKCYTLWNCK